MNRLDLDYDIRRDIPNSSIVREVDRDRQRELWRLLAVGVCLVAVLLFSAWQHFQLLRHGYEIEQMEQERAQELEINRHLRLEIETLRSPRTDRADRDRAVAPGGSGCVRHTDHRATGARGAAGSFRDRGTWRGTPEDLRP